VDFSEAARRFVDLQALRRNDTLTASQFRAAVDLLKVQDTTGKLWQPDPDSGGWLYWDGQSWLPGVPQYRDPPAAPPVPHSPPPPPPLRQQKPVSQVPPTPPPPPPRIIKPEIQPTPPSPTPPPPPPRIIKPEKQPEPPSSTPLPVPTVTPSAQEVKLKHQLNKKMVVTGLVVLAIILAGVFVVLPAMSGTKKPSGGTITPPSTTTAPFGSQTTGPAQYPASATRTGSGSLEPGPTQNPPSKLMVYFAVVKDAVTDDVTVTLSGGPGLAIVKNVDFRLTRSDGQVLDKAFAPTNQKVNEATLKGTPGSDRVEITVTYFSGEHYKMVDQLVQMRQRM